MGITEEEDLDLLDRYDAGAITYEESQKILENWYRERGKATKENIYQVVLDYNFLPGARKTIKYLHNKRYEIALISGSIDFLVEHVAGELNIVHYGANNSFVFNENNVFTDLITLGKDSTTKLEQLKKFTKKLQLKITECACVGDRDNDIELFKDSKHGITFNGSTIEKYAWKTIDKLEELQNIF